MLKTVNKVPVHEQGSAVCTTNSTSCNQLSSLSSTYVSEAIEYIKANFAEECSLNDVAKHLHLSYFYASHLFRKGLNMSFQDYRDKIRVEEAKRMLENDDEKIETIAFSCGYSSTGNFRKAFKAFFGITPKDYRNKARQNDI